MSEIKLTNVPSSTVGKTVAELTEAYSAVIGAGLTMKTFPSVMLWGPPGVGKSQAIRQLAEKLGERTGKRIVITDVRLLLFNPIDLRGIPTANADKTLAVWLKPKIFQMDESDRVVNILFLDEISAAPQTVQAAAYQITLDRVVGEHKLPDNCIVIAAGNRTTDKSVAYKMPRALANRLLHIEVESNFDSWREWAITHGINERVLGFLAFRPNYLTSEIKGDDLAFATPRSWEMVSNVLNHVNSDTDKVRTLISGLIGTGVAHEFCTWCRVYADLPDINDIFAGRCPSAPTTTDALYALISSMTVYARQHRNDMRAIGNSIVYANKKLPADFSTVLLKDYMYIEEDYKKKLITIPEFQRWLQTKGRLLNGNI